MERRCIYCGTDADLSESDIIPDALTNARIMNKNVCRIAHNNQFSDMFESKVISALSFITNELDIKSSKSAGYPAYHTTVTIEGNDYEAKIRSDRDLLGNRVLTSSDKQYKFGRYDKILRIAKGDGAVQQVDINQIEIEKRVTIDAKIFFDDAMYRMIAKIAYEWYCAKNAVNGYHSEFKDIVSYITEGQGTSPVSIIQNKEIYQTLSENLNLGSHALFAFETTSGEIDVIVSLFGVLLYRVVVAPQKPEFCSCNFLFAELCTDSSRREVKYSSIAEAYSSLVSSLLVKSKDAPQLTLGVDKDAPQATVVFDKDMAQLAFVLDAVSCFDRLRKDDIKGPSENVEKIMRQQIQDIVQSGLIHKKSIKRFVREYFYDGHDPIQLNPCVKKKKKIMFFYVVYLVGKSELEIFNDTEFQKLLYQGIPSLKANEVKITDELATDLKDAMIRAPRYSDILERGAAIIKGWEN